MQQKNTAANQQTASDVEPAVALSSSQSTVSAAEPAVHQTSGSQSTESIVELHTTSTDDVEPDSTDSAESALAKGPPSPYTLEHHETVASKLRLHVPSVSLTGIVLQVYVTVHGLTNSGIL